MVVITTHLQRFPFGNDVLAVCIPVEGRAAANPTCKDDDTAAAAPAPAPTAAFGPRRALTAYELRKAAQGAPWLALVPYRPADGVTPAEAAAQALVKPRAADMR